MSTKYHPQHIFLDLCAFPPLLGDFPLAFDGVGGVDVLVMAKHSTFTYSQLFVNLYCCPQQKEASVAEDEGSTDL